MTTFRVWAPLPREVQVDIEGQRFAMNCQDNWWTAEIDAPSQARYHFVLDGVALPDPASRRQPDGVHGSSQLYDQDGFVWTDQSWTGRALPGAIIYELHIGTFTPGATFDSAIERLDHLAELGVTHVEVLPVNAFNGTWGWGYDGSPLVRRP